MGMIDQGDNDEKIICVHLDDPAYAHYNAVNELPPHTLREIERFFRDYKKLECKVVVTQGMSGADEAKRIIMEGVERYNRMRAAETEQEEKRRQLDQVRSPGAPSVPAISTTAPMED
eukprot:Protomagalhaensia_wolfi_Nauph_80__2111@NODE_2354_length_1118_cov_4070_761816_g1844_i0_p1_GENE_NODE_2354_length_1118_cov_4070_761816_g1844_i0NODE_2354_length_1118_cov_4070_761816_g1844_i0_p1_ORF_typecomplete_len117_score21_35Pyrophosphatase/PF00719_19/6_1e20rve_3/PF13683_6/0_14_NODE_2354_length_1118_cov_4070_761816_g1844_i0227577